MDDTQKPSASPLKRILVAAGALLLVGWAVYLLLPKGPPPLPTGATSRESQPQITASWTRPKGDLLADASALVDMDGQGKWVADISVETGYKEPHVRFLFDVRNPKDIGPLRLTANKHLGGWTLNGKLIPQPLPEMKYAAIPAIPSAMLCEGPNVLEAPFHTFVEGPRSGPAMEVLALQVALAPQTDEDLAIDLGPVLGYAGEDFFTVTCRTTLPADVTLSVSGTTLQSAGTIHHAFKVTGLKPGTQYSYSLTAAVKGSQRRVSTDPHEVSTYPHGGKLVFAAMGDNREGMGVWRQVSQRVLQSGAAFTIHTGDSVHDGLTDALWVREFWMPAKALCASKPGYYVIGNHEQGAPIFPRIFSTPSGGKNWQQQIGPVLLVGIDNVGGDWSQGSDDWKWLDGVLKDSPSPFIFLVAHRPAYSSVKGEGEGAAGGGAFALLEKYHGTAMIAGHAHCYERLEPGKGSSVIVTAGAGAPLHNGPPAQQRSPFLKVFASERNYCLFTVEGDTCTLRAYKMTLVKDDVLGEPSPIDEYTWKARLAK